jgi:hypothetical protein
MSIVTKLEAANRQLCTAIRLFFDDGDAIAVHTLACSAREIYEKHCAMNSNQRMFDFMKSGNPQAAEKDLWNLLNAARNFFKHPGQSLNETIEFDDTMNDFQLLTACQDCATLMAGWQPPEMQAYALWFLAVEAPDEQAISEADPAAATAAQAIQHQIDAQFPGLRTASRIEKKRFGRCLLKNAGRLIQRTEPRPGDIQVGPHLYVGFA